MKKTHVVSCGKLHALSIFKMETKEQTRQPIELCVYVNIPLEKSFVII